MIPLASYEPDRSVHMPDASSVIVNAKPVKDGWGPLKSLQPFADALAAAPRGGFTGEANDRTLFTVAGTADALYRLNSDGSWTDVKKAGGYTLNTGEQWSFTQFGNRIIAAQGGDPMQYWDIGGVGTTFADLPNAPTAKYVMTVGDFVVAMNIDGEPSKMSWCGSNDSEQWTPLEGNSDFQKMPDGGEIVGGLPITGGAIIFQRHVMRSMQFSPSSGYVFTFTLFNDKRGCIAPYSIAKIGANDFIYLSEDGWFRGVNTPIGAERIDRTFFEEVDTSRIEETEAKADPFEKVVWIRYPIANGYRLLGYNWQLDRWFQSDQDTTGFGIFATSALTLEDLDALYPSGVDSIPVSLDDKIFAGGRSSFGGFDGSFRLGFFNGPNLAAKLETHTAELQPSRRAFVRSAQVIGDLGSARDALVDDLELPVDDYDVPVDSLTSPTFTMNVGTADFHGPDLVWSDAVDPNEFTGIVPFRSAARVHRFRVNIPLGSTWRHCIAVRPEFTSEGNR